MLRVLATAIVAFTAVHTSPRTPSITSLPRVAAADIRALMAEAATAPPLTCLLAARSIGNGGWWRGDVPIHPLAVDDAALTWEHGRTMAEADVTFLLDELERGSGCTRELAIRLLANEGGESVRAGLHRLLRSDDPDLVAVAALGAGLVHERSSIEPLLAATSNPSPIARVNVTWALGWIGDSRAYVALERALGDGDARVRTAAAGALGRIDTTAAVTALIDRLGRDDVAAVRRAAAWALGQRDATDAVGALGQALRRDADAEVREMSAWAIGSIDRPGADAALLEAARGDAERDVREMAVWALGVRDDKSHAEALGAIIAGERDAKVRATAAWALGVIGPATAPRGLIDAVRDGDEDVRQRAAWALSEIGDSTALPAIRTVLARDNNDRTQRALLRALIRSGESEDRLVLMFDSPDARVRETVARSLAGTSRIDVWPWPQPRPRPFP